MAPLVEQKQLRAPAPSGAVRTVFLRLYAKERRGHNARNRGFGLASCSRGLVFPDGDTTGPKSRGRVFPEGDIADPNAQRGYRRVGTVGVGLFFGCSEGGFLRFSASVWGGLEARNCGFGLASCSRGLVFPQGDVTGPKSRRLVFPEGDIADPNVQRGYRRVGTVGFCHFLGAVKANARVFPPTGEEDPRRDTTGSDSRRAPEG